MVLGLCLIFFTVPCFSALVSSVKCHCFDFKLDQKSIEHAKSVLQNPQTFLTWRSSKFSNITFLRYGKSFGCGILLSNFANYRTQNLGASVTVISSYQLACSSIQANAKPKA